MSKRRAWLTCFVGHRLEMLISAAWQEMPRPLARMIERLEIEHLRHGGFNNGQLYVSYGQFVQYGVSRRMIARTAALGEALGLIEVIRDPDRISGDLRAPNAYRLTFLPAAGKKAPTDEWRSVPPLSRSKLWCQHSKMLDASPRN